MGREGEAEGSAGASSRVLVVNFRGPLRIEIDETREVNPGEDVDEPVSGYALRFFATNVDGREVEVELRVGRGGVVFALPLDEAAEQAVEVLPEPERLRPVIPEARTKPFDLGDFK